MTIGTFIDAAVFKRTVLVLVNGWTVAGGAHLFLPGPQQPFLVAGMRGVTIYAGDAVTLGQVAVHGLHLLDHLRVAFSAPVHADLAALPMTGIAALLIRLMENIADQGLPVAAMGIVAGKTGAKGRPRIVGVLCLERLRLVAGAAELIRGHGQEHGPVGIVRLMTDAAFTVQIGLMGIFVFLFETGDNLVILLPGTVAGKAAGLDVFRHQSFFCRGMRFMANRALEEIDGLMHNALLEGLGLLFMAGKTEFALLVTQQALVASDMGIVTGAAVAGAHWLVHYLLLEQRLVMAGKTGVLFRCGHINSSETEEKTTDRYG